MPGRLWLPEDGPEELLSLLTRAEQARQQRRPDFRLKRGEIGPGDSAVVLAPNRNRQTALFVMKWGFRLDKKLVFNARCESAAEKAMFRQSLVERRCVVPAVAFFEWDHRMEKPAKLRFWPEGRPMMYLAGLYRFEPDAPLPVFTVLTRQAEGVLAEVHDRMPIVIQSEQIDMWLDRNVDPRLFFEQTPAPLACQPA